MTKKYKVLIVDDSAVMRQLLHTILAEDRELEVIGAVPDPLIARERILRLQPDVLTLDVEMPGMDGITFLEKLMRGHPMPVVMISSLTQTGCDTTLRALELGAVDFIPKPKLDVSRGIEEMAREIREKVKNAAKARVRLPARARPVSARPITTQPVLAATHKVVAIGASTGGTEALKEVLVQMPPDSPGVIVVQHMPERFTSSFAARLDQLSRLSVSEARDGDRILPGHVLLAPGNYHMEPVRNGAEYRVRVFQEERVNHHRPSVDVMFRACARRLGQNAIGVILTGMGADGAAGMLEMHRAGAYTIAQDEHSCVVFGMPREAIEAGGVDEIAPLEEISSSILKALRTTAFAR